MKATIGLSWRYLKACLDALVAAREGGSEDTHVDGIHFVDFSESLIGREDAHDGESFKVFADLPLERRIFRELMNENHFRSCDDESQRCPTSEGREDVLLKTTSALLYSIVSLQYCLASSSGAVSGSSRR